MRNFILGCYTDAVMYRQVEKLTEKAHDYEALLKDLGNIVETRTADRIKSLLDKV